MGRHSRRGPAPKSASQSGSGGASPAPAPAPAPGVPAGDTARDGRGDRGDRDGRGPGTAGRSVDGTPVQGTPRIPDGTPAYGTPRFPDGTPAGGVPRVAHGAQAGGVPRVPGGPSAQGAPRLPDGTPARGTPGLADGTPAGGTPRLPDGTPARGVPRVRGGHPQQRETGGGWGELGGRAASGAGPVIPRQRPAASGGPRQEYLDAFAEDEDVFARRKPVSAAASARVRDPYDTFSPLDPDGRQGPDGRRDPSGSLDPDDSQGRLGVSASVADPDAARRPPGAADGAPPTGEPAAAAKGGKGRAFTGVAAAAVTTVLAVVVAGQVADSRGSENSVQSQSAADQAGRDVSDSSGRGDDRPSPSASAAAAPLTYEQKMARKYEISATLEGPGTFEAVPGVDKAPGTGQKYTYRVDVEEGLGLDAELFAQAVQTTLNDDRSWAHNGARTFERIYSGDPDFVITLASPGTTADWCARSGLDTTVDNVSCDSAATQRVMINAYRWAQGSETYGDAMHSYRQMLINHEVGHRLGYNHVTCDKDGDLAPVMQQQTKFLEHDGIRCLPNAWPYPES
ncbi:DUF3152 domain-containing protein [Streptomyces sp. NPDC088812]|uniref:DUF3152 domain-containing protein n=1 Tax=Streptomyces sp. NPDC088812 TaxID=3365905 RepID=UPI0038166387